MVQPVQEIKIQTNSGGGGTIQTEAIGKLAQGLQLLQNAQKLTLQRLDDQNREIAQTDERSKKKFDKLRELIQI